MTTKGSLRDRVMSLVTMIAAIAAIIVVVARLRFDVFASDPNAPRQVKEWQSFAQGGILEGPRNAPVRIVEFSDFQCPFCRRAAVFLDSLRKAHPTEIAVVYRNFPIHEHAFAAAKLAECAAAADNFWPTHMLLFTKADSIGVKPWSSFALESGIVDTAAVRRCMERPAIAEFVRKDSLAGVRLDVTGTPTFLVNDTRIAGFGHDGALAALVEKKLKALR